MGKGQGSMLEQVRFAVLPLALAAGFGSMILGGVWTWFLAIFFVGANLVADAFGEDYLETSGKQAQGFLTAVLWTGPILHLALFLAALLRVASPGSPLFEVLEPRGGTFEIAGAVASYGVASGLLGVSYAHELIHGRTYLRFACGQAILAACLHPATAVEHVYGHHRYACTPRDPTFAARGVGFWRFLPRMWAGEGVSALLHESDRARRSGRRVWSLSNRVVRGGAMTATIVVASLALAGPAGLTLSLIGGFTGLLMVALGHYVTHYGLAREPRTPMQLHHSWNAPRPVSTSVLINSPRHGRHHAAPSDPYWSLTVPAGSPCYPHGMSSMSVIAMVPPLWFRVTGPLLDEIASQARLPLETAERATA